MHTVVERGGAARPDRHDLEARRMSVLAAIRPTAGTGALPARARRDDPRRRPAHGRRALALARGEARVLRLGYWSLLAVACPATSLMRVGAEWIYSKEAGHRRARRPGLDRHRLHHRRRRRAAAPRLADHRRHRCPQAAQRRRSGPAEGEPGDLDPSCCAAAVVAVWAMAAATAGLEPQPRPRSRSPQRPRAPQPGTRDRPSDTGSPLALRLTLHGR